MPIADCRWPDIPGSGWYTRAAGETSSGNAPGRSSAFRGSMFGAHAGGHSAPTTPRSHPRAILDYTSESRRQLFSPTLKSAIAASKNGLPSETPVFRLKLTNFRGDLNSYRTASDYAAQLLLL